MIHRKLPSLMSAEEVMARTAASAMEVATSARTAPAGSISVPNADGSRTVIGVANDVDGTGTGVGVAQWVGDTTAPGRPIGVTAASSAGIIVAFWSGSLEGGVPADFDHVTLYAKSGTEKITLGKLAKEGSVTSASLTAGTAYDVWATAEDAARAQNGTLSPNVSGESAHVSVTINAAADPAAVKAAQDAADDAQISAAAAQASADVAGSKADSAASAASDASKAASTVQSNVNDLAAQLGDVTNLLDSLNAWVKVGAVGGVPCLNLGTMASTMAAYLTNSELAFTDSGVVVASVSGQALNILTALIKSVLGIGDWRVTARSNGHLSLTYGGTA